MYVPVEGTSFNNSFICAGQGKEGACVGDSGGGENNQTQPIVNVNNNHTYDNNKSLFLDPWSALTTLLGWFLSRNRIKAAPSLLRSWLHLSFRINKKKEWMLHQVYARVNAYLPWIQENMKKMHLSAADTGRGKGVYNRAFFYHSVLALSCSMLL